MRRVKASHPFFAAPLLVFIISVFMIFLRFADFKTENENLIYAVMILLQTVIFGIPAVFFCVFRGRGYVSTLGIRAPRKKSFPVIIFGTLLIILLSGVMKFGIFHFAYDYSAYSLYGSSISIDTDSFWSVMLIILSLAVFPAITEEFVFRGIVMREYRICGSLFSMIMSSLFFAFIHFDLLQFPVYFLLGFVLSWTVFLTGSVFSSFAVHLFYNLFVIFGEKYIWLFSSNPDSDILFFLILIVLLLLCVFFFLCSGERILRMCSENGEDAVRPVQKEKFGRMLSEVFTSLPLIGDFVIFLVVGIIAAV